MDTLLSKFSTIVNSVIAGFDRIVFKGIIPSIMYSSVMQSFLISRGVLNKDFKEYATRQSQAIVASAEEISKDKCGCGIS